MDFEDPDHAVLRLHYKKQTKRIQVTMELTQYLIALFLAVIISVLFLGLSYSTEYFSEKRLEKIKWFVEHDQKWGAMGFAVGSALAAVLLPTILVIKLAPEAIGSGMPDTMAFLNGASSLHGIKIPTLTVKYIGVIGLVSAGLFAGIDGPLCEIGAGLGIILVRKVKHVPLLRRLFYGETLDLAHVDDQKDSAHSIARKQVASEQGLSNFDRIGQDNVEHTLLGFFEQKSIRIFATLGAAIALAVIFESPIGGVLFAVEEASTFFEISLLVKLMFVTIAGYFIVSFSWYEIRYSPSINSLYLNPVSSALFPINSDCTLNMGVGSVFLYILIGIFFALFGQGLNRVLSIIQLTRQKYLIEAEAHRNHEINHSKRTNKKPVNKLWNQILRVAEVLGVATLTSVMVVWIPASMGSENCTALTTPLSHIANTVPSCSFSSSFPLNCENLKSCKEALDLHGVCYPRETAKKFNDFVIEAFQKNCGGNYFLDNSTVTRRSGDASLGSLTASNFSFSMNFEILGVSETIMKNEDGSCFYQVRSLLWSSPERQLKMLLLRGVYSVWDVKSLLIFASIYIFLNGCTYYIALPTDLVVPNLIVGSALGRIIGLLVNSVYPGSVDPGAYALLGMTGLWSGTSGLVLTVTAIALEMTGDMSYLPAIIVVSLMSAWMSRLIGPSLYHIEMENNGAPYLSADPPLRLRTITTRHIMTKKIMALAMKESVAGLKRVVSEYPYMGYPVVEELGGRHRPIGYVYRSRIEELLKKLEMEQEKVEEAEIYTIISSLPLTIWEETTASKVYYLFRQLGLKRVFVVDREGFLTGLVMRRDLLKMQIQEEEKEQDEKEKKREEELESLEDVLHYMREKAKIPFFHSSHGREISWTRK
ncbi:voltage gated chloride channel-domain-containing protein [Chytriomyces sp. MP71]|nr:voltage gated chloride channel-domain-containing protein [Chytriomyces sp. MP71]